MTEHGPSQGPIGRRGGARRCVAILLVALLAAGCSTADPTPPNGSGGPPGSPGSTAGPTSAGPLASDPPVVTVDRVPPCELLYKDEAGSTLGVAITETQAAEATRPGDGGWLGTCLFLLQPGSETAPLELTLGIGDAFVDRFEGYRSDPAVSPVPGLGDEALLRMASFWGIDGEVGSIFVRRGDAILGLAIGSIGLAEDGRLLLPGDGPRQREILVELADIAIGRLTAPPAVVAVCPLLELESAAALAGLPLASAEEFDGRDAWGPACVYRDTGRTIQLYVAVNARASARGQFDACRTNGEPVGGLGDEAYYSRSCTLRVEFTYFTEPILLVRTGTTLVTVATGQHAGLDAAAWERSRALIVDAAERVLGRLGVAPGPTPTPVAFDPFARPCGLLADAEASAGFGVPVIATREDPGGPDYPARCFYATADDQFGPLDLALSIGPEAITEFAAYRSAPSEYIPVPGIGDEAYQRQEWRSDVNTTKLVRLFVRRGDAVVELSINGIGWVDQAGGDQVAPGDVDEQLVILRRFAELVLGRL